MAIEMKMLFMLIKLPLGERFNTAKVNAELYEKCIEIYRLCML